MRYFIYGIVTTLLLVAPASHAEVFKCTTEDGGILFQQTPCPEPKAESAVTQDEAPMERDCQYAVGFADSTARFMRAGVSSAEVFARYNGLDALSRSSISVINYVYSFRTNSDATVERIVGQAEAKCRVGSFGDATCESFPSRFTEQSGGCGGTFDTAAARHLSSATAPAAEGRNIEEVATCKQHYRDAIDAIDAEMRRGYSPVQGEAYRQELHHLTEKLRAC